MFNMQNWQLEIEKNISLGDFNNVADAEKYGSFPGKYGDCAATNVNNKTDKFKEIELCEAEYSYFYKGDGYFYGIKKDNTEVIAILTHGGKIIPAFAGAGEFNLKNNKRKRQSQAYLKLPFFNYSS